MIARRFWNRGLQYLLLSVFLLASLTVTGRTHGEEIDIDLRRGGNDPLIDFVPPPVGSPDRARFTNQGLRIAQTADVAGKSTGIAGFKSMIAATGDFTATLDLRIEKLSGPSSDWGHALVFAVFLDDPKETVLKLNQVAYQNESFHQSVAELSGRGIKNPEYFPGQALIDGKLIIERVGREARFFIEPAGSGERIAIASTPCPVEDVRSIEVWSTRVAKGNAPAEILVRRLVIDAGDFYAFKPSVFSYFSWWTWMVLAQVIVVGGLGWVWLRKRG